MTEKRARGNYFRLFSGNSRMPRRSLNGHVPESLICSLCIGTYYSRLRRLDETSDGSLSIDNVIMQFPHTFFFFAGNDRPNRDKTIPITDPYTYVFRRGHPSLFTFFQIRTRIFLLLFPPFSVPSKRTMMHHAGSVPHFKFRSFSFDRCLPTFDCPAQFTFCFSDVVSLSHICSDTQVHRSSIGVYVLKYNAQIFLEFRKLLLLELTSH
ncbi:hypothetical protein R3P38DRAFT_1725281 [Favolaschia claudopus]|uniref:Uncharacterized protein n=1 Tax=Favolaschia claudopus TaxID=2862362 RepID=A0AAW0AAX4_9AGAR